MSRALFHLLRMLLSASLALLFVVPAASAKKKEKLWYGFFRKVGNSWKYEVEQSGPRAGTKIKWVEEHEVLNVDNWGRIRIIKLAVAFRQDGKLLKQKGFVKNVLLYKNGLWESRGQKKFSRSAASKLIHSRPPTMQWVIGITTWSNRRDKRETYRAGGLKEFKVKAGTFKYVKTFAQSQLAGRIKRMYWVDFRVGILKMTLSARTPEGVMNVTKILQSYSIL